MISTVDESCYDAVTIAADAWHGVCRFLPLFRLPPADAADTPRHYAAAMDAAAIRQMP